MKEDFADFLPLLSLGSDIKVGIFDFIIKIVGAVTFVNVTSDPTLTNDANVIGVVPTSVAETLMANNSVASTSEPFVEWILNGSFMPGGESQP